MFFNKFINTCVFISHINFLCYYFKHNKIFVKLCYLRYLFHANEIIYTILYSFAITINKKRKII